ncbi:hypothetical protein ZIOFF_011865 [Zingiber officinale]|uniref:Uncharacterized protein n=1 Tax=Zingiber officinale TaxID=94328 RepID=A0A8J5M006_ZINOF|nr:hypothetical protein ZIOFF_011865 [Zingiber officinale]
MSGLTVDLRWSRVLSLSRLRRFLRLLLRRLLSCSSPGGRGRYRRLKAQISSLPQIDLAQCVRPVASGARTDAVEADPDLVTLKISLLGDQHTGKTSFMMKYLGDAEEQRGLEITGRIELRFLHLTGEIAIENLQAAIPILIGTKFDDFAQLPLEMQWAIVNQDFIAFTSVERKEKELELKEEVDS